MLPPQARALGAGGGPASARVRLRLSAGRTWRASPLAGSEGSPASAGRPFALGPEPADTGPGPGALSAPRRRSKAGPRGYGTAGTGVDRRARRPLAVPGDRPRSGAQGGAKAAGAMRPASAIPVRRRLDRPAGPGCAARGPAPPSRARRGRTWWREGCAGTTRPDGRSPGACLPPPPHPSLSGWRSRTMPFSRSSSTWV